jgi:hypothetical protein
MVAVAVAPDPPPAPAIICIVGAVEYPAPGSVISISPIWKFLLSYQST